MMMMLCSVIFFKYFKNTITETLKYVDLLVIRKIQDIIKESMHIIIYVDFIKYKFAFD